MALGTFSSGLTIEPTGDEGTGKEDENTIFGCCEVSLVWHRGCLHAYGLHSAQAFFQAWIALSRVAAEVIGGLPTVAAIADFAQLSKKRPLDIGVALAVSERPEYSIRSPNRRLACEPQNTAQKHGRHPVDLLPRQA